MPSALYFWLATLSVFFYVFYVDLNVPLFCELYLQGLKAKIKGWIYMLKWNPVTPWGRYNIWKTASENAEKNTRVLRKELNLPEE